MRSLAQPLGMVVGSVMLDQAGLLRQGAGMEAADLKTAIEHYTGLERDALHVHVSLLIYSMAMAVFRQSRRSRFPWLTVLVIELLNEALDLRRQGIEKLSHTWEESLKDLWNTMLWPTVLLFVGRHTGWFQKRGSSGS